MLRMWVALGVALSGRCYLEVRLCYIRLHRRDIRGKMEGICQACWDRSPDLGYDPVSGGYKCPRCRAVDAQIERELKEGN